MAGMKRQMTRRLFLGCAAGAAASRLVWAAGPDERALIEKAIPDRAPASPRKRRRLLIFDLNVNYGGHGSIPTANAAFELMGKRTGAFETVISRDPTVFERSSLDQFDAVFFNNTVGNLFEDATLRRNLVEFVYGGGGLMGVHGTSVAFTRWPGAHEDWPEFGVMLGARGASHRENTEHVFIKLDDPEHPVNQYFDAAGFEYRDEFFRFHEVYSRQRVRVLLSIDTTRTKFDGRQFGNTLRADNDYALAWVRQYGRGRVFYSTIAHNPYVFWDRRMLQFYLAAAQFVLGDLDGPTLPSAKLTPAVRAQEKLGWRLGIEAYTFHRYTLFEAIDKTAELGLPFMGGLSFQKVSKEIDKDFEPGLTDAELEAIRLKLDAAGVRMLTYYFHEIPGDEAGCRRIFEFGRKIGIETFMSEPKPEALDMIERFCDEYDINVAIHNHGPDQSPVYWRPEGVLKVCEDRSRRIGACGDVGYWMRAGIDPIEAVRMLKGRLITVQMHDLHEKGAAGHDVPWGTGVGRTGELITEVHRLGIRPTMFGMEYSHDWFESMPKIAKCIVFFNELSMELAAGVQQGR
ncbi:MAG TPA: ThuA domain-containing protein [Anaerohalosphaeraceae bacterium]|nr:ThuA domain-containing protein [Anaerohalosphaeraceae bacterium]HRT49690.1 ThuA domain-containing protein [Anaerohalosphaeraceae bacterium]HRT86007.1 ThuA domain-containing protein [Anaerohalosphaeraceae bacterium]